MRADVMKLRAGWLVAGSVLLVGCATSPPTTVREAKVAHPGDTPSSQALTPVITTADDPRILGANRYAREMGYRIETRHGVQYYCRVAAPLGSRLTEKQCLTVDGMAQAKQITDQNRTALEQAGRLCGPACVGN
jgi:hypothetical protein